LILDNVFLDDSATIASLGVGNILLLSIQIRDTCINRLHLVDASDRRVTLDFDHPKYRTFQNTTSLFTMPADSIVTSKVNGNPLRLLTPLWNHIGHAEYIIRVLFSASRLQIVFHEGAESYKQPVCWTRVSHFPCLPHVSPSEKPSGYLIYNSQRPGPMALILQINPDLDPVYLHETKAFTLKAGTLCMFRHVGISHFDPLSLEEFPLDSRFYVRYAPASGPTHYLFFDEKGSRWKLTVDEEDTVRDIRFAILRRHLQRSTTPATVLGR
jgi:hypothetical protein